MNFLVGNFIKYILYLNAGNIVDESAIGYNFTPNFIQNLELRLKENNNFAGAVRLG